MKYRKYDIAIIGAGIVGCAIASYLSKFKLKILVLEKNSDVGFGISKSNSGIIHSGYDDKHGSLKSKLCKRGNILYEQLSKDLDFKIKNCGSLVVAKKNELNKLLSIYENGMRNGISGLKIINKKELYDREPMLENGYEYALYSSSASIISPYDAVTSFYEHGLVNEVDYVFNEKVKNIKYKNYWIINRKFSCDILINSAGIYSDDINNLISDKKYRLYGKKGEYFVLDKRKKDDINSIIFTLPNEKGKGVLVSPTVEGNLLIGPNANFVDDKRDYSTTYNGLNEVSEKAKKIYKYKFKDIISTYAGLRPEFKDYKDFVIDIDTKSKYISLVGIKSPGLTCAPSIAEYIVNVLKTEFNKKMLDKGPYIARIKKKKKFIDIKLNDLEKYIKDDINYTDIVCRCEKVSKAEILDAIDRGKPYIDSIKFRTRATMGRCHGGFCFEKIINILKDVYNINISDISKNNKSKYFIGTIFDE